MRKLRVAVLFAVLALVMPGYAGAEDMVKVHQCGACGYTVPTVCPHCGAKLEEKELTAGDAQTALDRTKDEIRKRV